MKRLCVAVFLAVLLTAGTMMGAKAATIDNFGSLGFGATRDFSVGKAANESFTDDFLFQVSAALAAASAVIDVEFGQIINIAGLTLGVFNVTTNSYLPGSPVSGGPSLSVVASALAPGTQYAIRITGTATGTAGGRYAGGLAIAPVPAALPLMLGALAGLGLIARRKTAA